MEMDIKTILTEQLITMLVAVVDQVEHQVKLLVEEMVETEEAEALPIKELDLRVQVAQEETMVEMALKELVK